MSEINIAASSVAGAVREPHSFNAAQVHRSEMPKDEPFPFMELPSELRLHVYRMAFSRRQPVLLHMPRTTSPDDEEPAAYAASNDDDDIRSAPSSRITVRNRHRRSRTNRTFADGKPGLAKPCFNTKPLIPNLLRVSKLVYREAMPVLYSDNRFMLHLDSAEHTLRTLHQRSRSLIKHAQLRIPTHHDILEGFADLVRLGLRYCWGLRTFTIRLPPMVPEERASATTQSVYANAFHILRWLPKTCVVVLEGAVPEEIRKVVEENGRLARSLDEKAYQRRQHQMPETEGHYNR